MKKELLVTLAWGGGILLLALGTGFAHTQGLIEHDTMLRIVIGVNGPMIIYYGNRAPKIVAPTQHAGQIARVAGWSLVLGGLVHTLLWAFAPIPLAVMFGTIAVAAAVITTLGYCFWLWTRPEADA